MTVLVATCIASAVLLPPLQARSVIGDGIASALYVGNYRFAIQGTDYLAADAPPSPLQHYWSLGVEEQFYLLWPALIIGTAWLLARLARRTGAAATRSVGAVPRGARAAGRGCRSRSRCRGRRRWPSWAFFSLPTRAWELAVGGLVALTAGAWRHLPGPSAAVVGWGGLALIVVTCTQIGETTPYPGTTALLPVLGTALVIGAGCATPDLGVGHVPVETGDAVDRSAVVLVVPVALAGAAARARHCSGETSGWRAGWRWWWCRSASRS